MNTNPDNQLLTRTNVRMVTVDGTDMLDSADRSIETIARRCPLRIGIVKCQRRGLSLDGLLFDAIVRFGHQNWFGLFFQPGNHDQRRHR